MIRHIVMWQVKGDTLEERLATSGKIKFAFEALNGQIPGLCHLEVGINVSPADYACDAVLFSEFESPCALRDYASHPAHLDVRDRLAGLRIARHQVDYEIHPNDGERHASPC
jgi:hypothetical protein